MARASTRTKVLPGEALVAALQTRRASRARIARTHGCFDLVHVGHVRYLEQAAALGDILVVGINSDRSVRALKGEGRPLVAQQDRASVLAGLAAVDYVTVFDDLTAESLVRQ